MEAGISASGQPQAPAATPEPLGPPCHFRPARAQVLVRSYDMHKQTHVPLLGSKVARLYISLTQRIPPKLVWSSGPHDLMLLIPLESFLPTCRAKELWSQIWVPRV